jgi:hypothetical protein
VGRAGEGSRPCRRHRRTARTGERRGGAGCTGKRGPGTCRRVGLGKREKGETNEPTQRIWLKGGLGISKAFLFSDFILGSNLFQI